jgi:hypothetical protein
MEQKTEAAAVAAEDFPILSLFLTAARAAPAS